MSPKISDKQIAAVTRLAAPERYSYFIKIVADWQEAWGLFSDGWALSQTDAGEQVFPLWPAKEYAALCATGDWAGYEPSSIPLEDLLNELLPKFKEDGVLPGVFFVPDGGSVNADVDQILEDLREEMKKYE